MDPLMNASFNIKPFYTMEMMKYAAEMEKAGKTICHLEVGQPSVKTPLAITEEAIHALKNKNLNYCSALGLLELRTAIAQHYDYFYQIKIKPENIVITPGSSLGLYIALLMNFNRGANIAIASPSYPCYKNVIKSLGFNAVEIKTQQQNNYLLMPEDLMVSENSIDGVLIASPNNPTGSMYDVQTLKYFADYCASNHIKILSDEIYHGITYEEKAESILKFNQDAIVINGFSKYFAMTGWRVGWLVVQEQDVSHYENLLQNMLLCSSPLNQIAATKSFTIYNELDEYVKQYKTNLNILYSALSDAGLSQIYKPKGAFYIYLELDKVKQNSMDFCKQLLYEQGIAVAPGLDFSTETPCCSIRLSFCEKQSVIEVAADKLYKFFKNS